MKKRLQLSLIGLVGSVLLFIITSLAWFTVSEWVNIGLFQGSVTGQTISYQLYVFEDGEYVPVSSLDFDLTVPGEEKSYRLVVTNPSNSLYHVRVYLAGVVDVVTNGDTSLMEVIQLESTIDSQMVVNDTFANLIAGQLIDVSEGFTIAGGQSETIDFSFAILGSAGNIYQGLSIEIDEIKIFFNVG